MPRAATKPQRKAAPHGNGNGGISRADVLELTADLMGILDALKRHHMLRPRECHQLGLVAEHESVPAVMQLLELGLVEIRFFELTATGKALVAEALA